MQTSREVTDAVWATLPWDNERVNPLQSFLSLDAPWEGQGVPYVMPCDFWPILTLPLKKGLGQPTISCLAVEPYAWLTSYLGWVNRLWGGRA